MTSKLAGTAGLSRYLLCGAAAAALIAPMAVHAQDTSANSTEDDLASGNAIVVTATKREQTLQEVPVAVTVATAETLEREQIRDLKDLQAIVPSLRVSQLQSSANTNFFIRGFGNGANNAGIEPSVGVFIDGVYRSRTAAQVSDLPNVNRIEVLRGPQSTLFGKNASAGVISIVTDAPSFTPTGSMELSYGNYDALVAKAYVSGPISDSFAVSLAAGYNTRDGYNVDAGSGTRTNERDRWFVRGQALYDNGENLSVRLIADYDVIDENCCGVVNLQSSNASLAVLGLGGQVSDPSDPFANQVFNNFPSGNDIKNYGVSGQVDYETGQLTFTSITSYRETEGRFSQDADFTSLDLFGRFQDQKLETFTQELRVAGDFGAISALGGIFYFDESVTEAQDVVRGPGLLPYADLSAGGTGSGAFVAGLEQTIGALYGDPTQYVGTFFVPGLVETGSFALDNTAISVFGQVDIELTEGLVLTLGGNYTSDEKSSVTDYRSLSAFSSIDLVDAGNRAIVAQGLADQVGGALMLGRPATQAEIQAFATGTSPAGAAGAAAFPTIQAGVQAFADANQANPAVNPLLVGQALQLFPQFINIPNSVEAGETNDNDFSYTVRLAYDLSPDVNVYASYATGFKASSFNLSRDGRPLPGDIAALDAAGLTVNNLISGSRFASPEESEVIEIGLKADWGDYAMNLTGFKQDINGFQSNVFTGAGFFLANAGTQRTWGVEFEGMANPIDQLTLNLAATWLDPEYVDFQISSVGDLSGTRPAGIAEWTVVLGGQWEQPLGNGDTLIARTTFVHESEVAVQDGLPGFLPLGQQAAIDAATQFTRQVDELSASVAYLFEDLDLELSVWGRNLTNDRYVVQIFDSVGQPLAISGYTNQPRTYGATARYRF